MEKSSHAKGSELERLESAWKARVSEVEGCTLDVSNVVARRLEEYAGVVEELEGDLKFAPLNCSSKHHVFL